ncbi:hypothetical protein [Agrobacterium leguminum]|uniref:hypothetical protein n=1 Tax=Agrobacterium leguminum TaxID=2792015 RepID=UPI0034E4C2E6
MPNLKTIQMLLLDDVFRMGGGYVLNFSDKTFGNFFREEVGIDIDHPRYSVEGGSKAKRFRYFVQNESRPAVVKAIKALWEYRQALMERDGEQETLANIDKRMEALVSSIGGQWDKPATAAPPASAVVLDPTKVTGFTKRLLDLGSLAPIRAATRSRNSCATCSTPTAWKPTKRFGTGASRSTVASSSTVIPIS